MAYAGHSDPYLQVAFWSGAIALMFTLLLLLTTIWLRMTLIRNTRSHQQFMLTWRPLIIRQIAGEAVSFPPVTQSNIPALLHLWVHYHESLRGDSKHALNQMLDTLNLRPHLRRLLQQGKTEHRLLAATALGYLGDMEVWDALVALARSPESALSLIAARALSSMDGTRAAAILIPLLIRRRDWSLTKVAIMLKEADAGFRQAFLSRVARSAQKNHAYVPRLLRLVESLHLNQSLPFVRTLIEQSGNPELVTACLRLVCEPRELQFVRPLLDNPHWSVRVQVAAVLGRLGSREDVARLVQLLEDQEWWVRYRAAQALASMPFINRRELHDIEALQTDPYARDILHQVLAETAAT